jgi:predicted TIM-barrel enzyme
MAGASPDRRTVSAVRDAVPDDVPVLVNTGVTADNVRDFLNVADGVIVGSALKHNGHTWNAVDGERVAKLMETARTAEQDADVAAR